MYQLENNVQWTSDLKNAFKHGTTKGKIKYDNIVIDYDTGLKNYKLYDEKKPPEQTFIGQATSRQVDLELINTLVTHNLENKEFELFLGADYNNQTYYINYGKFIVNQIPQNDVTNGIIKITAFDYMIKANIPYVPGVTFPCTLKDVVDDICTQTGLVLGTQSFANMNFIVEDNQFDGKTCKEVLRHVGKCAFSWVRIGQDNKLYIDFEVDDTITESLGINDYYQDKFKKANQYYGPINRVVYAESNIQGQEEKVEDTDSIALNGLHELVIYDNYFAYTTAKRQELIQAGTRLFGLKYMPIQELAMPGLAYLDCKDFIEVTAPNNLAITTLPLNHIIEYDGAVADSLTTEASSNNETAYKNTNSPINANSLAEIIVDRAMREIRMIVDQYVNFLHNKSGNNNIFINETRDGEGFITKFVIKGSTTYFTETDITLIASEDIKGEEAALITQSEDAILTESGDGLIVEDKTLYLLRKSITLDAPLRSLVVDDVLYYDELQILQDGTVQIIRRIGVSQSEILYLLDKEEITILEEKIVLPARENGLYYFVEELNNLDYYAEYIIKNEYSDVYATEAYVNAGLNLKVDTNKLVSELNASADVIRLVGERLIIAMKNFSLDETGYMKAISGQVGGFKLGENSFSADVSEIFGPFTQTDFNNLLNLIQNENWTQYDLDKYDLNGDNTLNVLDSVIMANMINGNLDYRVSGTFEIRNDSLRKCIIFRDSDGNVINNLGVNGVYFKGAKIDQLSFNKLLTDVDLNGRNMSNGGTITASSFVQSSKEEYKKNIEKFEKSALELVKNGDIYEFNYKTEEDKNKKHLGFIIGENYHTPDEVISQNQEGINTYSVVSILWKAVQEQQKQIEELQKEIKILKGEK